MAGATELRRVGGACATRTYAADTRTLTIDFSPTNCLCPDRYYWRGKIMVHFTGTSLTYYSGAVVTLESYFVNDNQHMATRTFTDLSNGSYSVDVANGSVIFAKGGTHTWTVHCDYARMAGCGTPLALDDVSSVTGQSAGTNRKGVNYTAAITKPPIKRGDCYKYYVAGVVTLENSKGNILLIDYDPSGFQACHNTASVTSNSWTKIIILH